eukprot:2218431-Prymnesium_polylepis.1
MSCFDFPIDRILAGSGLEEKFAVKEQCNTTLPLLPLFSGGSVANVCNAGSEQQTIRTGFHTVTRPPAAACLRAHMHSLVHPMCVSHVSTVNPDGDRLLPRLGSRHVSRSSRRDSHERRLQQDVL